jgi:hypothetical protein
MADLHEELVARWPNVPRVCFGFGEPIHLNACVDWVLSGPDGMTGYIEGYRRAAESVYATTIRNRDSPDYMLFPLAFLWRHHLELALKHIIALGRSLEDSAWGFPEHHRLLELWHEAKVHIVNASSPDAPELANVEANLSEFQMVDPGSFGFRYPTERNSGARTLAHAPSHVNLGVLHEAMQALSNYLDAVQMELSVRLDYLSEMRAEYERAYRP